MFFLVILSFFFDRKGNAVHSIGRFWSRAILLLAGVHVNVKGIENIPKGRPVIIASNHQGAFDIPVLQGYIPLSFRWIAKKSLFKIPVIGWSMSLAGYIAIERESGSKAYRSIIKAAEKIRSGTSVLIFPEGTRSESGEVLPFKKGGFLLSQKSGVPILPVAIKGTAGIMKRGSIWITPSEVSVSIGRPIETEGVEEEKLRQTAKEAVEGMLRPGK